MRHASLLLIALALAGCGNKKSDPAGTGSSSGSAPPPVTADAAPVVVDATVALAAVDAAVDAPVDAPIDAAVAAEADPDALAKALLGDQEAAAYSSTEKLAVIVNTYHQEGTGAGLAIGFKKIDESGTGDTFDIYEPGDEDPDQLKAEKLPQLAAKLKGKGYVSLGYTPWPEKAKELTLPTGVKLGWTKRMITIARGPGPQVLLKRIVPDDPHKPSIQGVFSAPGIPVVLVKVFYDPGESYGDFNAYSEVEVLDTTPKQKEPEE